MIQAACLRVVVVRSLDGVHGLGVKGVLVVKRRRVMLRLHLW